MAKKKKQTKGQGKGSAPGSRCENAELEEGSPAWLQEQKRLFEQYQKENARSQSAVSASSDGFLGSSERPETSQNSNKPNFDEVIESQRRLLEEAARGARNGTDASEDVSEVFSVRRISFSGRKVPVLLQNRNGPCSLLAVANALILKGFFQLTAEEKSLTSADLVKRLGYVCETLNAKSIQEDANARKSIHDLIERLPKFLDGLDVNVRFSRCSEFEYTQDLSLFDCFSLKIFHVWVEPKVAELANSWNALAERLAICAEIRDTLEKEKRLPKSDEGEKLAEAIWLEEWLEETRSQSTSLGLQGLRDLVNDGDVCVLFRNNHFTTIYRPNDKIVCALLTDASFEEAESAVWESIELDGGAGDILDSDFKASAGSGKAKAASDTPALSAKQCELLELVQGMGFSSTQAEAGLSAVNWKSAEEAIEALLEADGDLPAPARPPAGISSTPKRHICPKCGKEFKSLNGQLNHQAAKGH